LRHRVVLLHSWDLPWFQHSANPFARNLLGGWSFTGLTSFRSGFPVTFTAGARHGINVDTLLDGIIRPNTSGPFEFNPVPIGSAGGPNGLTNVAGQPVSAYAASLGLSQPLLGNYGTLGRGVRFLNGERMFNWAFGKKFFTSETTFFQFRAEFTNTFNNTSFQDVDRNISSPNFGNYLTIGPNQRVITLNLRFVF
jgi:hypothetical protein